MIHRHGAAKHAEVVNDDLAGQPGDQAGPVRQIVAVKLEVDVPANLLNAGGHRFQLVPGPHAARHHQAAGASHAAPGQPAQLPAGHRGIHHANTMRPGAQRGDGV